MSVDIGSRGERGKRRRKAMAAQRTVKINFEASQGIHVALSARQPKGWQQAQDAADADAMLVAPWMSQVAMDSERADAVRMLVVPGAKDRVLEVKIDGSVYNYVKESLDKLADSEKLGHQAVKMALAAKRAIDGAKEVPPAAETSGLL